MIYDAFAVQTSVIRLAYSSSYHLFPAVGHKISFTHCVVNDRYCPRCKEQRQASKKLDLWRLPEVLVIHLKRFSFSRSTKHKLETFVNFPIHDLDLTNYIAHKRGPERQLYELYALSNHYGGMASGHYTAHIKVCFLNASHIFLKPC